MPFSSVGSHTENGDIAIDDGIHRGVQYPFAVNEKVLIKNLRSVLGNRRTPEKFVGKEAVITSQCLNGWLVRVLQSDSSCSSIGLHSSLSHQTLYLLKIIGTGENVRLQYRSLRKILNTTPANEDSCPSQPLQHSSS
ncbi:U-box domain-containing protein 62, partial [Cucurbita argyrosperma subsp. argyrosperma]